MKADLSRDTFSSRRHYSAVLMQQGRVQMDADWNEQQAITRHRIETEARDLIGASGGRVNDAGFEISVHEEKTLSIGAGNFYVDGILCQNETPEDGSPLKFEDQPLEELGNPAIEAFTSTPEVGLVYLDVWERHLTALDDDHIREVALGGPDTATRAQTVWRVRVLPVEADTSDPEALEPLLEARAGTTDEEELAQINARILELLRVGCASSFEEEIEAENPPSTGELVARTLQSESAESPCVLPPSAGYERLENQLYRVEIHDEGDRDEATFKWSRDNGSVVAAVLGVTQTPDGAEISVRDLGRDDTLGFKDEQYVELVSDDRELVGSVQPLAQITNVDSAARTITVDVPFSDVDKQDAEDLHYKLRRWDSAGTLEMPGERFVELEGGVQVKFREGHYNTGDYWLIPARTATGEIEWPEDEARPPAGIHHHYARLALVMAAPVDDDEQLLVLADCRRLFPYLTELTSFFYAGGDGQEALPAGPNQPGTRLPHPLRVGVANGQWPVAGTRVSFATTADLTNGRVELENGSEAGTSLTVLTGADGIAECYWRVNNTNPDQQVTATLFDDGDGTLHLPVYFGASLSLAREVSYTPGEVCANLEGVTTVQEAIDELCKTGDNVPGIVIEDVVTLEDQPLPHDGNVPAPVLAKGLRVVCSEPVDEEALGDRVGDKRACFVSLDLPHPINDADQSLWGIRSGAVLGYQRLILSGSVRVEDKSIVWEPADEDMRGWLNDILFAVIRERFPDIRRIQSQLTLKGNFIWAKEDRFRFLDGETFGMPATQSDPTGLDLPSGDLRRGGDFEMWFWLETGSVEVDSVSLNASSITGGGDVTGGVVLSREAESGTSIALASNNPAVVFLNSQGQAVGQSTIVTVLSGQDRVGFKVRTSPVLAARPVTITAQREGSSEEPKSTGLTVQPPRPVNLFLNPNSLAPGGQSTGTVILDGVAPPASVGGLRLTLSSGDRTVATVPNESNPVPPGTTQVTFPITAVSGGGEESLTRSIVGPVVRNVIITASYAKTSASATLRVVEEGDKFFSAKPEFEFPPIEERFVTGRGPGWTADQPEEAGDEPDRPSEGGEPFIRPEERPESEPPPPEPPNE